MPFPSSLDNTQENNLRANSYYAQGYVAVCPSTVIFRASVNQASFDSSFAQVTFDNVTIGAFGDIKQGMTVFIGSGTDLANQTFTGRVRKVATSTILYINETSAAITDNMTISVIDDRRVWDRLQRVDPVTLTRFKDYDLTFQQLAPTIYNLQSSYVLVTTGVSASVSFAPLATPHTVSASISSYLWDVADGTITVGNSTTQNITVSFPTGHRWVRLTVTDSGSRVNFIDFEVYCGDPRTASWSLPNVRNISITGDTLGFNATFDAWQSVDTILDQTRVTIFTVERYGSSTTPIVSNISMVGYLKNESQNTSGDETLAQRKLVSFDVDGFGTQLGNINMVGISAIDSSSPTIWGQINDPTPPRFNAYLLIYHTTISNLCSISFGTDEDDYIFLDLSAEATGALDSVNGNYDQINGALNFAPSGEMQFNRNANYMTNADRVALTTVADITTVDMLSFNLSKEYGFTVGRVLAGFGGYTTATGAVRAYSSKAPAESALGAQEEQQLNSQILIANQTESQNRIEAGQRTGDHLAYINPKYLLDVTFGDGWWWLTPANFQWYTFTIATTDNLRDVEFTTATRWLCVGVNYSINNETGRRSVSANFEQETQGNSSQVLVALIPSIADLNLPTLPMFPDYPFDPPNPAINYPVNSPNLNTRQPVSASDLGNLLPIPAPAIPDTGEAGCQTIILPAQRATNLGTSFDGVNGSFYTVTVKGSCTIAAAGTGAYNLVDTFSVNSTTSTFTAGVYNTIPSYVYRVKVIGDVNVNTGAGTVQRADGFYYTPDNWATQQTYFSVLGFNPIQYADNSQPDPLSTAYNPAHEYTFEYTGDGSPVSLRFRDVNYADNSGSFTIEVYEPTFTTETRGDAFYHSYNLESGIAQLYPTGFGLYGNDSALVASSEYNPSHEYTFELEGDGLAMRFRFENFTGETPSNELFTITVCGEDAGDYTT